MRQMKRVLILGVALVMFLTACGSNDDSGSNDALQKQADTYAIDQIEVKWHQASSKKDVDLMMSLWAPDATLTVGPKTYAGKAKIREFFSKEAAPFQPGNDWVSETPAYKIRTTVDGDKGTIYFECHYVDVKTGKVVAAVGADQDVARIDGDWLITNAVGATVELSP
jgi:hypothetical protein